MYYETYRKKTTRSRRGGRRSFGGWLAQGLLKLAVLVLVLAIAGAALLYALPPALFMVEPPGNDLALTDGLPGRCINVLLLGADLLRDSVQRSDSITIASIGYGRVCLTSVLRDTTVDIPGHGSRKVNAAFAYGGPELMMKTLNLNFGLNIMHYAQVDFVSIVELIDAIGGVTLDITDAERARLNSTLRGMGKIFRPLGYTAHEVTQYGENVHLDGLQALAYARIRKIDSDFRRAGRQRKLLNAMLKQLRSQLWNPAVWVRVGKVALSAVKTNMSVLQLVSLGEKALLAGTTEQLRLRVDGSFTDDGSRLSVHDRNANRDAFYRFVYEG